MADIEAGRNEDNGQRQIKKRVRAIAVKATSLSITYLTALHTIFTIISNFSRLGCNYWWVPFSVTLLVSSMFFIEYVDLMSSYLRNCNHLLEDTDDMNFMTRKSKVFLFSFILVAFTIVILASCRLLLCNNE